MEPSASLRTSRRSAIAPANGMHNRAGSVPTSSTIAREEAEEWWSTYTKTATSMISDIAAIGHRARERHAQQGGQRADEFHHREGRSRGMVEHVYENSYQHDP